MEAPVINDSTFSSVNPSSYSLSEIWPITITITTTTTTTTTTTPPHTFDSDADHSTLTHHHNHERKHSSSTTTPNHLNDCSGNKHMKLGRSSYDNGASLWRDEADANSVSGNKLAQQGAKANNKPSESLTQDYIHVRARRGQATDSHSLAERARREKISERMKILQDLVPGCNKVIGKALVLDEIINYIQSLHHQVEFLSMKLEAVNSRFNMSPTAERFPSKEVGTQPFDLAGMIFGSQTRGYVEGSQPGWLHRQLGGGFERT